MNCTKCGVSVTNTIDLKLYPTTYGDLCVTCFDPFDLMAWDEFPSVKHQAISDGVILEEFSPDMYVSDYYNLMNSTEFECASELENSLSDECVECGNTAQNSIDECLHECSDDLWRCLECLKNGYVSTRFADSLRVITN